MRPILEAFQRIKPPAHPGLAYDVWKPLNPDAEDANRKKQQAEEYGRWLDWIESAQVPPGYDRFLRQVKTSFQTGLPHPSHRFEATLSSRLLLGHGNPSPIGVGLSLHHTWGVPYIPGTALKGLLAQWFQIQYGPLQSSDDNAGDNRPPQPLHPFDPRHPEPERALWQGVAWNGTHIAHSPGTAYRRLFGAPDADDDQDMLEKCVAGGKMAELLTRWKDWLPDDVTEKSAGQKSVLLGARQGLVQFHDALLVPDRTNQNRRLLERDVLTVHQRGYYEGEGEDWPNDYDDPNPVQFITVRPGLRFHFALTGPQDWVTLAGSELQKALREWGIGGKTAAGYGRFDSFGPP